MACSPDETADEQVTTSSGWDDLDRHRELHVGVELQRHEVGADRADGLREVELLAVDLDARLGGDGLGDVRRGDRAEQLLVGADAGA